MRLADVEKVGWLFGQLSNVQHAWGGFAKAGVGVRGLMVLSFRDSIDRGEEHVGQDVPVRRREHIILVLHNSPYNMEYVVLYYRSDLHVIKWRDKMYGTIRLIHIYYICDSTRPDF